MNDSSSLVQLNTIYDPGEAKAFKREVGCKSPATAITVTADEKTTAIVRKNEKAFSRMMRKSGNLPDRTCNHDILGRGNIAAANYMQSGFLNRDEEAFLFAQEDDCRILQERINGRIEMN